MIKMTKSFGKALKTEPNMEEATAPAVSSEATEDNTPETETNDVPETNQPSGSLKSLDPLGLLEGQGVYKEAGAVYGALNHIGDVGVEVGFQSGSGAQKQRSGIGIYLRVDHVAKRFVSMDKLKELGYDF